MKMILKIKNRIKNMEENWRTDCRFSIKLACFRVLHELGGRLGFKKISKYAGIHKEKWVLDFLRNELMSIMDAYHDQRGDGYKMENAPVWVCWWDGLEKAPIIVKRCVESIEKNSGKHKVCLITMDNYSQYVQVPDYILEKVESGKMGKAHFADYLRVCLLEKYGGLWLDATIYCTNTIPEEYFNIPFFTCKSEKIEGQFISDFQWTTFCLGGWQYNLVYRFLKEAFECYWRENEYAIDYLFFDDLLFLAKENISEIKRLMEEVPVNNIHRDDLQAAMNKGLPADELCQVIQEDTVLYKLSWREKYRCTTADGKATVYSCIAGSNESE